MSAWGDKYKNEIHEAIMNYVYKHPEESVSVQIDEILDAVRLDVGNRFKYR